MATTPKLSRKAAVFINEKRNGKLATLKKDGSPHVTPMWYAYEGGKFILNTNAERLKYRNIMRDPRVSLLIDDGEDYVLVEGRAVIARERDGLKDAEALSVRYVGRAAAKEHVKQYSNQERVTIVITPEKVVTRFLG